LKPKPVLTLTLLIFLAVSLIFGAVPSFASQDAPATIWSKTYAELNQGGQADVFGIVQTSDGGYAFIADAWIAKNSSYACLLVKLDSQGNLQWNKIFDQFEVPAAIVQTTDGGYGIAGFNSKTTCDLFGHSVYSRFFWFAKTDLQGNIEWTKNYGDQSDVSECRAMIATSDGGFALAGDLASSTTRGWAALLIKIDSKGNQQWTKIFDTSPQDERFSSIVETLDGGFALAGQTGATGNIPLFWLVKTDSVGNMQWNKTYKNPSASWVTAYSAIQTSDGGYALAGYATPKPNNGNDGSFWLVKTDSAGIMQWESSYGKDSWGANNVVQTLDGGYVLSGCIEPDNSSIVLVKTDSSGKLQWTCAEADKNAFKVILTKDSEFVLAGRASGSDPTNMWVAKLAGDNSTLTPPSNNFDIESNSTISGLYFNATKGEIAFTVNGADGTAGYVKATISKSLMPNGDDIKIYLDNQSVNFTITEKDDSWLIIFTYHHSAHQIRINSGLASNLVGASDYTIFVAMAIIIALLAIVCLLIWLAKQKD
jgi:hypothetical protein